ncbi:hypothetical protein COOONC_00502 [Cooperia oncophora]
MLTISMRKIIELRSEGAAKDSWIDVGNVDSHVRATTLKDLAPNKRYQFRVKLLKDDSSVVQSHATSWMSVDLPTDDILPVTPLVN